MNIDEANNQAIENNDVGNEASSQSLIIDEKKDEKETIEKQDVDTNISVKCVNDRRL